MKNIFKDKTILVTGGCGSIGSEIVRQLLKFNPKVIRIFDHDEAGHFRLNQSLKVDDPEKTRNLIGDITDRDRVFRAMEDVDIVFHAAALKHVPFCEYNPFEAVKTNVIGTQNLVDAAIKENVDIFVGISTDKAVNPINTMGATKLLAEKIITNAPIGKSLVKFCCVRFGNVLNSSGSVIPIFLKEIEEGYSISITSEKMTRFFMSLHDSVSLVIKAAELTEMGEVFILKMNAINIKDLAEVLVEELAPRFKKNPKDYIYNTIGVRPGEKMHESLMVDEEVRYMTEKEDMFILRNSLLAHYSSKNGRVAAKWEEGQEYNSENAPLLNKEQIRKTLKEDGII
ncbi:SDR family NAD(P)-dependent oxidoreductase [Candidatus Woesearchaeota archaeon]|nr:SDR family NAD(P)-dependent oxidoreductase [Candidatus Woesearchaeota archaeon]